MVKKYILNKTKKHHTSTSRVRKKRKTKKLNYKKKKGGIINLSRIIQERKHPKENFMPAMSRFASMAPHRRSSTRSRNVLALPSPQEYMRPRVRNNPAPLVAERERTWRRNLARITSKNNVSNNKRMALEKNVKTKTTRSVQGSVKQKYNLPLIRNKKFVRIIGPVGSSYVGKIGRVVQIPDTGLNVRAERKDTDLYCIYLHVKNDNTYVKVARKHLKEVTADAAKREYKELTGKVQLPKPTADISSVC